MFMPPVRVLDRAGVPATAEEPETGHDLACAPVRDWHPLTRDWRALTRDWRAPARDWRALTRDWRAPGPRATSVAAVIRREWLAGLFTAAAIFAAVTALTSVNPPERVWGGFAAVSYLIGAVTVVVTRRRGVSLAVLICLAGAVAAPLAWMALTGMAQPEVTVIIRSATTLVHRGTPYASPAALAAAHTWRAYDPYLPALIVFGVPRVFGAGLLTDPRIWFGVAFVATFGAAVRIARVPRPVRWTLLVTASPVVALPLAAGGDDLPVLGLTCLGLALACRGSRDRWRWAAAAGLALGLAAAMKATAWPAVAVVAVLLAARQGWRAVTWFAVAVLGAGLVTDGPVVAAHPAAALANTVLFPLGLTRVASPAASMLPGHMLAGAGGWGHWTALVLVALAGTGVGMWLIARPPKSARAAGWRLALGLTLLFLLAPASRVGYFVYPLGLVAWLLPSRWPELPRDLSVDPEPQHGRHAVQSHH